jgi:hypothetical protein
MSVELDGQRIRECAERLTVAARSDPAAAQRLVEEIDSIVAANPQPIFEAYRQRARGHLLGIRGGMTVPCSTTGKRWLSSKSAMKK